MRPEHRQDAEQTLARRAEAGAVVRTPRIRRAGLAFENGVTDEQITKGGIGTVRIVLVAANGNESDTGRTVEARNRYATVAAGKKVGLVQRGGVWFLIAAECG